jgi:hypothetical protein
MRHCLRRNPDCPAVTARSRHTGIENILVAKVHAGLAGLPVVLDRLEPGWIGDDVLQRAVDIERTRRDLRVPALRRRESISPEFEGVS